MSLEITRKNSYFRNVQGGPYSASNLDVYDPFRVKLAWALKTLVITDLTRAVLDSSTASLPEDFTVCFSIYIWRIGSVIANMTFKDDNDKNWLTLRVALRKGNLFR